MYSHVTANFLRTQSNFHYMKDQNEQNVCLANENSSQTL